MPDVFLSYSLKDKKLGEFVHKHLDGEGLAVFRAPVSLRPGERWDKVILENLKNATWILFLASKEACKSAIVQQELGVALGTGKKIVPVVWDMNPSQLPGFLKTVQALDLRHMGPDEIRQQISEIAKRIRGSKRTGWLIAAVLIAGVLYVALKK